MVKNNLKRKKGIFLIALLIALLALFYFAASILEKKGDLVASSDAIDIRIDESLEFAALKLSKPESLTEPDNDSVGVNLNEIIDSMDETTTDGLCPEYVIDSEGDYILSGDYDGIIAIDAPDANVHLFLNGVSIKSPAGPAIRCKNAANLIITLMEGTDNSISDYGNYSDDEEDATIMSKCDVIFNGNGSLGIDGVYDKAVHTKDVVKIAGGNIKIKSMGDGIVAKDGIAIYDGNLEVNSKKNCLESTGFNKDGIGNIVIYGGNVSLVAGRYGIKSDKADVYAVEDSVTFSCVMGNIEAYQNVILR